MTKLSSLLGFPSDLAGLGRGAVVAALIVLAAFALRVLLVSWRRSLRSAENADTITRFVRMLQDTAAIRLLAVQVVLLVAVLAKLRAWPSAELIVNQSLAVAGYFLLSDWGARQRQYNIHVPMAGLALLGRCVVIGGGTIYIAFAPPSHTLAIFMASTMTLAAGFFSHDKENL